MTINPTTKQQDVSLHVPAIGWLRSPWSILVSVGLAIYVGTAHKEIAVMLAPLGSFYLGLLKMCVLPILLAAITTSIGRLMRSSDAALYIKRILVVFPLGLVVTSGFTVLIATLAGPGRNLSTKTLKSLGVLVIDSGIDLEMTLTGPLPEQVSQGIDTFLISLVPDNIFSALSQGDTLKVLMFSIIVGTSLGLIRDRVTEPCFDILEAIYRTFNQLINWLTIVLPIGLFSLLAYQLSQQGLDIMLSMINFVLTALIISFVIYVLSTLVVWQQSKVSLLKVLAA